MILSLIDELGDDNKIQDPWYLRKGRNRLTFDTKLL